MFRCINSLHSSHRNTPFPEKHFLLVFSNDNSHNTVYLFLRFFDYLNFQKKTVYLDLKMISSVVIVFAAEHYHKNDLADNPPNMILRLNRRIASSDWMMGEVGGGGDDLLIG